VNAGVAAFWGALDASSLLLGSLLAMRDEIVLDEVPDESEVRCR